MTTIDHLRERLSDPTLTTYSQAATLERLERLVSPYGVVAGLRQIRNRRGLDRLHSFASHFGSGAPGIAPSTRNSTGIGRVLDDPQTAQLIAIAEGVERYAGGGNSGLSVATARLGEMDGSFIDPESIPRCSESEYSNPRCPLRPFDPALPIRWVKAAELTTGDETWIPAVMAAVGMRSLLPGEDFWYQISTGHAVHSDPVEAVLRGVFEVVERDANALLWLQQLAMPKLDEGLIRGEAADDVAYLLDWCARHFIDTHLIDATTDVGVPTVYCLQACEYDAKATRLVGCAADSDPAAAARKAILETILLRDIFHGDEAALEDVAEFFDVGDSARYMATPERRSAFDFMIDGSGERAPCPRTVSAGQPAKTLAEIVARLRQIGCSVYVTDRTTPEIALAGLVAVSVVIPELQPMSLHPLAQYRAHPRLYSAPVAMGYPCRIEEELNPWPQPFA